MGKSIIPNNQSNKKEAVKTHNPLVTPAKVWAIKISIGPKGAISKSIIEPWTFAVMKAEDAFAKEFWITLIIIETGIKKVINGTSLNPAALSIAIENTITKSKVVTMGAVIVCKKTLVNLFTSIV